MSTDLKLQYMYSGGCMGIGWIDIQPEDAENFINKAMNFTKMTREQVIEKLEKGGEVQYDVPWDSKIHSETHYKSMMERLEASRKTEMVKCTCGHTVPKRQVMGASLGTSCPDCYDKMSD